MKEQWGGGEDWGKITFPPHQLHKNIALSIIPRFDDPVFLHQKYIVEGLSVDEIAGQIFSSSSTVHKRLREFGIITRPASAKNKTRLAYGEAWRDHKVVPHQ